MPGFEEQFGIILIPEPYRPALPAKPNVLPDVWWEHSVRTDLEAINKTKVGHALLEAIKHHGVIVSILPDSVPDACSAGTLPMEDDLHARDPLDITMGPSIYYSPERFSHGHRCQDRFKVFGQLVMDGHETLLHELVHAFRLASFKYDRQKAVKGFSFYNNTEEIYAILVQGIYASERGRAVRGTHVGQFPIGKELDGSFAFFQTGTEAFEHVKKFCVENPGFTKAIARVETRFNPIRAYYCDPRRAEKMSRTPVARGRDRTQPLLRGGFDFLAQAFRQAGLAGP